MEKPIRRVSQRFRTSSLIDAIGLAFLTSACSPANVVSNALFGDHAVLQQGVSIPVWGTADRAESVTFDDET